MNFLNSKKREDNRNYAYDLIRIVAIVFVVITHSIEATKYNNDPYFYLLMHTIGRLGVPLFFMLTGSLLLTRKYDNEATKKFYLYNLLPLLACAMIWLALYSLSTLLMGYKFSGWESFFKEVFFVKYPYYSNWWYMPAILILYAFIPFIAHGLQNIKLKYTLIVFLVLFILGFAIPSFSNFTINFIFFNYFNFVYLAYLILGYIVHEYLKLKIPVVLDICIFALMCTALILLNLLFYKTKLWYNFALFPMTSFFIFTSIYKLSYKVKSKVFYVLSNAVFGVYLIHPILILLYNSYWTVENTYVWFLLNFAISFFGSFAISVTISFIPYANIILIRARNVLTYKKEKKSVEEQEA